MTFLKPVGPRGAAAYRRGPHYPSAVDRRGHARNERAQTRGRSQAAAAQTKNYLHDGLFAQRHHAPRSARYGRRPRTETGYQRATRPRGAQGPRQLRWDGLAARRTLPEPKLRDAVSAWDPEPSPPA